MPGVRHLLDKRFSLAFLPGKALLIVSPLALVLTGCGGGEADLMAQLEAAGSLPLWQRVVVIALATLVSEDLACIAAGMLASEGVISFAWALGACFLGILFGDLLTFFLGRLGGLSLLRRAPMRWMMREDQIVMAEELFLSHGAKLIFTSRLLPGSRLPVYAAAGVLGYPLWKFALFLALAGGLSVLILVGVAYRLGDVVFDWLRVYEAYALPVVIGIVILVWITVKLIEILATRRSRLVFLVRGRRLYHRLIGRERRPTS